VASLITDHSLDKNTRKRQLFHFILFNISKKRPMVGGTRHMCLERKRVTKTFASIPRGS
jgi:hypothetical protein